MRLCALILPHEKEKKESFYLDQEGGERKTAPERLPKWADRSRLRGTGLFLAHITSTATVG
jgi:hypothetical protein